MLTNGLVGAATNYFPANALTRNAMSVILNRFMGSMLAQPAAPVCSAAPFTDVPAADSSCAAIQRRKAMGLSRVLTTSTTFTPSKAMARAEVVTLLYQLSHRVRVATYNVRLSCVEDDLKVAGRPWQDRSAQVAQTILAAAPDVIGLQEASGVRYALDKTAAGTTSPVVSKCADVGNTGAATQLGDLIAQLASGGYTKISEKGGVAILIKNATVANVQAATPVPIQSQYLLSARLKLKMTGTQFTFATTHLLYEAAAAKEATAHDCNLAATQQTQLIQTTLKTTTGPMVLAGDFNSPFSGTCTSHAKITTTAHNVGIPLTDAQTRSASGAVGGDKGTTNGWGVPGSTANKYDRIFVSGSMPVLTWVNVVPTKTGPPYTSDHDLVYSDTLLP